jgi:uncharacterized membrane protein
MLTRCTTLLVFTILANGCGETATEQVEAQAREQTVVAEETIDNVWHKARLRGVSFRAIGQEPGWLLEITDGKEILVVTNYGQERLTMPYVEPVVDEIERTTRFIVDENDAVIEIRGENCQDSMSGESFEVTVTVRTSEKELNGCGRALY